MDLLIRCFFPDICERRQKELKSQLDETFVQFVEEAVKNNDITEEDVIQLIQALFPNEQEAIETKGLTFRIDKYKKALLLNSTPLQTEQEGSTKQSFSSSSTTASQMYSARDSVALSPFPSSISSHVNSVGDSPTLFPFSSTASQVSSVGDSSTSFFTTDTMSTSMEAESSSATALHHQLRRHNEMDVEMLRDMCGMQDDSQDEVLIFLMNRIVHGDVEDAGRWLIDNSFDVAKDLFIADQKKKQASERANSEAERLARERVLQKFDEKAVPSDDGGNRFTRKERMGKTNKDFADPPESKVRYLNGKIVTTNGAKYIEIKDKEDWDGGSRGRVKTKGKRGPGWVGA
jgi:hypothetical protein